MRKQTKRYFTLIEVMIVLAIIGIIAGIGVPQFQKYRDAAQSRKRLLNIETFKNACEAYKVNYDIVNPTDQHRDWTNSNGIGLKHNYRGAGPNLGLKLEPWNINDDDPADTEYSVYDFIKGGRKGLKVGKSDFCPNGSNNFRGNFNSKNPYRFIDFSLWKDASRNIAAGDDNKAQFYHDTATGDVWDNSTGRKR